MELADYLAGGHELEDASQTSEPPLDDQVGGAGIVHEPSRLDELVGALCCTRLSQGSIVWETLWKENQNGSLREKARDISTSGYRGQARKFQENDLGGQRLGQEIPADDGNDKGGVRSRKRDRKNLDQEEM